MRGKRVREGRRVRGGRREEGGEVMSDTKTPLQIKIGREERGKAM